MKLGPIDVQPRCDWKAMPFKDKRKGAIWRCGWCTATRKSRAMPAAESCAFVSPERDSTAEPVKAEGRPAAGSGESPLRPMSPRESPMADYQMIAAKQGTKIMRMYWAMMMLRDFYDVDRSVCRLVHNWMELGMDEPIPFPSSPHFPDWAEKHGLEDVDGCVGMLITAQLSPERKAGS